MNILITGASRGTGASMASYFASKEKTRLFLTARSRVQLEKLKDKIRSEYPYAEIDILPADLSRPDDIQLLVKTLNSRIQALDALINNAGYLAKGEFASLQLHEIERSFMVNYTAPALLIKGCLPLLRNAANSHVVNISSMGGFQGSAKYPGLSHYSASKAAIASLTECLAEEFKGLISFNCIAPGAVQTQMLEEAFPGLKAPVDPEDMARFIADFTLNAHKYMNGKIIPVSLMNP